MGEWELPRTKNPLQTYILKRLLLSIPMLIGILFISFFVMQLAPGQAGGGTAGEGGARSKGITREQREVMNRTFHMDKPLFDRFLFWLGVKQENTPAELEIAKNEAVRRELRKRAREKSLAGSGKLSPAEISDATTFALDHNVQIPKHGILFGDFGYSMEIHSVRVVDRLASALPISIMLNAFSLILIYLFSIPMGVYSATHSNSKLDRIATVTLFMMHSMPSFWVAVLLIKLIVSLPEAWRLPFQGLQPLNSHELTTVEWLAASAKHLILPLIVFSYSSFAVMSRFMRSSMMDTVRADYIRTARAKGLGETTVIYKHALRNSLIPIITLLGSELPSLIGGSVIIEAIFGIPGMGYVGYKALLARDYTVLMADLTLVAILVMAGFLISDLLYKLADPRIDFEAA